MQTELYEEIKKGAQDYFAGVPLTRSYKPTIVGFAPSSPTYPLIIIDEVDNTPYQHLTHMRQTVASVGYKIDIYAETKGNISKQQIARTLMKHCDDYCKKIGLTQVSMNAFANDGTNGKLYHIILMYSARFFENKQYFV